MKKLFVILILSIVILLPCFMFGACSKDDKEEETNEHTHYAENYTVDYVYEDQFIYHWKVCDICGEEFDKEEHTFVDGYCTVCNFSEEESDGLKYTPITHEADKDSVLQRIVAYSVSGIGTATDTNIIVPSYYLGKAVIQIDAGAFQECKSIRGVTIGRNVVDIGDFAFLRCVNLASAEIPDKVSSIGKRAFFESGLSNLSVGNGVTSIASEAFDGTDFFDDVTNWQDDALYIGQYLISVKPQFSGDFSIKQGTSLIADGAFLRCENLSSVNIPETVKYIGNSAFYQCTSLNAISIPDSVYSIGGDAFVGCSSIKDIKLGNGLRNYSSLLFTDTAFYKDKTNWTDSVLYIGQHLVATKAVSGDCTVKEGTLTIAMGAFYMATALSSITIPDSVLWIGAKAFANCSFLEKAHIGSGVKYIGMEAFDRCRDLREMTYNGTIEQWLAIEIVDGHIDGGLYFTLQCSDGKLDEYMNIIK